MDVLREAAVVLNIACSLTNAHAFFTRATQAVWRRPSHSRMAVSAIHELSMHAFRRCFHLSRLSVSLTPRGPTPSGRGPGPRLRGVYGN